MPDAPKFNVEFGKAAPPAGGRLDAAAFHRNHAAIAGLLVPFLQDHTGHLLEIGSGTGQHAVDMARQMPTVTWWPTDLNDSHLRSIAAWRDHSKLENLKEPVRLDASAADWQLKERGLPEWFTVMFCANVIHIAPWRVAEGLFAGAGRYLRSDGRLFLYGPFKREGKHTAMSNAVFDTSLRQQDAEWGVRDIADIEKLAAGVGLALIETVPMPANNLILVFGRSGVPA
jgi:SAM-dependent methyltransferase